MFTFAGVWGATLINSSVSGNSALTGGGIYNTDSITALTVVHSILWGNTDEAGTGEASQIFGRSPCIDAGNNAALPRSVHWSLNRKPRFLG